MKKRAILVHGWGGHPEEGWRPWLKNTLEKEGFEVSVPSMPDTDNPDFSKWLAHLKEVVEIPDENIYFVGHSLGCITILRYLESLFPGEKVGGVILVAGFAQDLTYLEYKGELKSFFKTPIDWERIKSHCQKFFALYSEDDTWVAMENLKLFEVNLSAEVLLENGMKHYSGDDGILELPVVFDKIIQMSS